MGLGKKIKKAVKKASKAVKSVGKDVEKPFQGTGVGKSLKTASANTVQKVLGKENTATIGQAMKSSHLDKVAAAYAVTNGGLDPTSYATTTAPTTNAVAAQPKGFIDKAENFQSEQERKQAEQEAKERAEQQRANKQYENRIIGQYEADIRNNQQTRTDYTGDATDDNDPRSLNQSTTLAKKRKLIGF